jgi:hypothetical protein
MAAFPQPEADGDVRVEIAERAERRQEKVAAQPS